MALPASQYSVLDAKKIDRIDDSTFRCYVNAIKLFNLTIEPILTVRVTEGSRGPTVKLLDTRVSLATMHLDRRLQVAKLQELLLHSHLRKCTLRHCHPLHHASPSQGPVAGWSNPAISIWHATLSLCLQLKHTGCKCRGAGQVMQHGTSHNNPCLTCMCAVGFSPTP